MSEMVGGASVAVQVMRKMVDGLSDGREVRWFECSPECTR